MTRRRPNVVVVVLDDLGFADLGCYGSEINSPNLDRLADTGLRYTNFHTTAMCSPTRASLLTGRNHHAVGMGIIAEWSTSHPGYTGRISPQAATLAEMLGEHGYTSYAAGKWHVMPQADATPAGPFAGWPLQRGFSRWYGFHGALADQWHPELFEDNHPIETPAGQGYHLSGDLVDKSVAYLRDHLVSTPDRPYFLYLAFGAPHWPHQAPREFIERYRGRYDVGWDAIRHERLQRQQAMGVVPEGTALAPRNNGVVAWDELDSDRRRLFARMQEVYAGFVEHTDAQIGRLLDYLHSEGQMDDTLIVVMSDNGASPEGGPDGAVNARKQLVYGGEELDVKLECLDLLGSDATNNHYPWGWAQASNTPLKWYKKDVHGGGVRGPLIMHWPAEVRQRGLRDQFHHVVDIVPTVLEVADITAPESLRGVEQMPVDGVSMAYTWMDSRSPTRRNSQYFELLGDRAYWLDGWKVVTRHEKGTPFEDDVWELYHVAADFSEFHDLADDRRGQLDEMVALWWRAAEANQVLPLDDREYERVREAIAARARRRTVFRPDAGRLDRYHVPDMTDRSYTITARLESKEGDEGVLLAVGSRFGGLVLYVSQQRAVFEYAYDERTRHKIISDAVIPVGKAEVTLRFDRAAANRGVASLGVNGERVGQVTLGQTWPVAGLAGGLHCGRDGASPVSDSYDLPFAFTGTLHHVVVELGEDGQPDESAERRRALAEE